MEAWKTKYGHLIDTLVSVEILFGVLQLHPYEPLAKGWLNRAREEDFDLALYLQSVLRAQEVSQ